MKRFAILLFLMLALSLWIAPGVSAQTTGSPGGSSTPVISQFVVELSEKGALFKVDGREYRDRAIFAWPQGSQHILEFVLNQETGIYQYANFFKTRFTFNGWSDNQSLSQNAGTPTQSTVIVTADPKVTRYLGAVTVEHLMQLVFFDGLDTPLAGTGPGTCQTPGDAPPGQIRVGLIYINGSCYWNNASFWTTGNELRLNAYPYPGYVFLGWAVDQNPSDAFLKTAIVNGPSIVRARFSPAKRIKFRTDPMGLRLRINREEIRTTEMEPCEPNNFLTPRPPASIPLACIGEMDFIPGSRHVFGGVSPQLDKNGRVWVFDQFDNGLGQDAPVTVGTNVSTVDTIVGRFKRGVQTSIATQPAGLKVRINGRDNWPENYFVFLPGSKQTVSAYPEVTDSRGRKYVFRRWSNGGEATHTFTVPEDFDKTFHLVAEYEQLGQIVIQSNAAGASVLVDGAPCATPCRIDRATGSETRIEALETTPVSEVQRLEFLGWSDKGDRARVLKLNDSGLVTLNATFRTAFKISVAADPGEGAIFKLEPSAPEDFYPADSIVLVSIETRPGFRFRRWDLDLSGTSPVASLHMARPRSVVARLDKVPFIKPAGIRNAAGITPDGAVAPGSLIFIDGADLAPYREDGPPGPILAQALARTSVLVGNRILPLIYVSPERIQAQLPRDLEPGEYEMRVIRAAQSDITGKFTVSLTAPGLFSQPIDTREFAIALHADGSPVTLENPAKRGEQITLTGTGFGAYKMSHPEGFALPPAPAFPLMYEVLVQSGEESKPAVWAGGLAGRVGIDAVRFTVAEEAASGIAQVKVRVGTAESNVVVLPIE